MKTRRNWLLERMTRAALGWAVVLSAADGAAQEPAGPSPTEVLTGVADGEGREAPAERRMETDRDSFTPAATTAGRGRLILETSYTFEDRRRGFENHSFPELLLRLGVAERVELRLGWNYEVGGRERPVGEPALPEEGLLRESRLLYGFKLAVTEQDGWVPETAVILQGFTPTSGPTTATTFLATYIAGWELADEWRLDSAIRYGYENEEGDRFGLWAPSVVLRVPVGERWNVHAEYFGLISTDRRENFVRHFVSPGVHYLVTPDLEVGVRVGWGFNDEAPRFFANAGLGWRY